MDNPNSSKGHYVQFLHSSLSRTPRKAQIENRQLGKHDASFLQQGADMMPTLRDVVENFKTSRSDTEVLNYNTGFIMTQMIAKAGIKKHGQVAATMRCIRNSSNCMIWNFFQ